MHTTTSKDQQRRKENPLEGIALTPLWAPLKILFAKTVFASLRLQGLFLPRGDLASNSSPQNIGEVKIYSGTWNIVGGVTSKAPAWNSECCTNQQMYLPLQIQCIQSCDPAFCQYWVEGCPSNMVCRFICRERSTKMSPREDSARDDSCLITHQVSAMFRLLKTQERLPLLFVPSTSLQRTSPAL